MTLHRKNQKMIFLGAYAYTIYLFHGFGTSAGRIIFQRMGIDSSLAIFLFSLLLGLGLPIVVDKALSRFRLPALLFLGKLPKKMIT